MAEVRLYHLTRMTLDQALPELLEKTLERDWRAVVMVGSPERAEALAQHLWIYKSDGFLPHGNAKDGNPDMQPIWLTSDDERPNGARVLFLTDGAQSQKIGDYERVCDIFDGNDEESLAAARRRWMVYKSAMNKLSYWQQGERGWVDATPV